MEVEVEGTIIYTCCLNDTDTEKVIAYAKANQCSYRQAVEDLYYAHEIDLYNTSVESDYTTNEVISAEDDDGYTEPVDDEDDDDE